MSDWDQIDGRLERLAKHEDPPVRQMTTFEREMLIAKAEAEADPEGQNGPILVKLGTGL